MTIIKATFPVKESETTDEKKKARIVVQTNGSKDKDKNMLITYSPRVTNAFV